MGYAVFPKRLTGSNLIFSPPIHCCIARVVLSIEHTMDDSQSCEVVRIFVIYNTQELSVTISYVPRLS